MAAMCCCIVFLMVLETATLMSACRLLRSECAVTLSLVGLVSLRAGHKGGRVSGEGCGLEGAHRQLHRARQLRGGAGQHCKGVLPTLHCSQPPCPSQFIHMPFKLRTLCLPVTCLSRPIFMGGHACAYGH